MYRVLLLVGFLAGMCGSMCAAEGEREVFRKTLSDGRIAVVSEARSSEHIDAEKIAKERNYSPGLMVVGGAYVVLKYTLQILGSDNSKQETSWRCMTSFPQSRTESPVNAMFYVRVFDVAFDKSVGYITYSSLGKLWLGAFGLGKERVSGEYPVEIFSESYALGRIVRKASISYEKSDAVLLSVLTTNTQEVWKVVGDKASRVSIAEALQGARKSPESRDDVDSKNESNEMQHLLMQILSEKHVGETLRRRILAALKKMGSRRHSLVDDCAVVLMAGTGKLDGIDALMETYKSCAPQLIHLSTERSTQQNWMRYGEYKRVVYEMLGGDALLGLFVNIGMLEELREHAEMLKQEKDKATEAEVKKIRAFIRDEAKKLLEEWPRSELKAMIEELAE